MHRIGSLPFHLADNQVTLLFVTSLTRKRWVLPKGVVKQGESPVATCVRETFEEAGVSGTVLENYPISAPITRLTDNGPEAVPVTYYPMLVHEQAQVWPEMQQRKRIWSPIEQMNDIRPRQDVMSIVQQFEALMPWITKDAQSCELPLGKAPLNVSNLAV